jgi:hypothetical protein
MNNFTNKDKRRYFAQKYSALKRSDKNGNKIEWKLTFEQWWDWWQATGLYDKRGCKKGQYVMARVDDLGPYELGNIFCTTCGENIKASNTVRAVSDHHKEVAGALGRTHKGKTRTEETKENIRQARTGTTASQATKDKMSASRQLYLKS